jgi:hypothetical protein
VRTTLTKGKTRTCRPTFSRAGTPRQKDSFSGSDIVKSYDKLEALVQLEIGRLSSGSSTRRVAEIILYCPSRTMHKKKPVTITSLDDTNDLLNESEFSTICPDADIIMTNVLDVLDGALKRRDAAAHPTAVID